MRSRRLPSAALAFGLVVAVCVIVASGYIAMAVKRSNERPSGDPGARVDRGAPARPAAIVFQHVRRDASYAHVATAPADRPEDRTVSRLLCQRVHFAAGRGLCLRPAQDALGRQRFKAMVFDRGFEVRGQTRLTGIITRARVSPDGRFGAATGFVTGHSYADPGQFSTQTTLLDMRTGKVLADLEDFRVLHRGRKIEPRDRNFWGVTFARDSTRFYATLQTGGERYLVEGNVRRRELRTLHANVECPSLSPDGTRIAYKKRVDGRQWRFHVLDLATMRETALAETRPVDDQPEWLDDGRILYGLGADVWAVRADGGGQPARLLADALSPAVAR